MIRFPGKWDHRIMFLSRFQINFLNATVWLVACQNYLRLWTRFSRRFKATAKTKISLSCARPICKGNAAIKFSCEIVFNWVKFSVRFESRKWFYGNEKVILRPSTSFTLQIVSNSHKNNDRNAVSLLLPTFLNNWFPFMSFVLLLNRR